jgi:hypothetical protein
MQQFKDWYWNVAGSTTQVYSSARNIYVPLADTAYQTWLAAHGAASRIAAEIDVWYYVSDLLPPWLFDGSSFVQPSAGAYTKTQLKAYAASVRYNKEIGGTTVSGVNYPTDRDTQAKMTAAVLLAQVNPATTFKWKIADGTFTASIDAAGMVAIASAVGAFVNGLFITEQMAGAAIDAGTTTGLAQIDAAFA